MFVPELLQHLECGAFNNHVYKMADTVHRKGTCKTSVKQDYISIASLVIVEPILKEVGYIYSKLFI